MYTLKFRSPNLCTFIVVTKTRKGFLKKKRKSKKFHHSSKLNLTTVRKSPSKEVVLGLLSFLIA